MDRLRTAAAAEPVVFSGRPLNTSSDSGDISKRRAVRRDPEKRRQQNIQAQKKYREKLKKRLDPLETLAVSAAGNADLTTAAAPIAEFNLAPTPADRASNAISTDHQSPHHSTGDSPYGHSDQSSLDFPHLILSPSLIPASSLDVAHWDPTLFTDPLNLFHDDDVASDVQGSIVQVDCGCLKTHIQIVSTVPRVYRDVKVSNADSDLFSADPYFNSLRVEHVCIMQAVFANCLHIGISEDMFCDDNAVSSFFRPIRKANDDAGYDKIVKSVQSIFTALEPDVRPVREQITTKHGPLIDVLPFPTLRKNLIRNSDAVDGDELYDDLLNGLVCWGRAGVGKRDRDMSTGHTTTGTPWDGRSWKAQVWFLQKYWALLGGEDGELVRQSEWWRSLRGDDASVWSGS